MTDPESRDKPRKPWARSARLAAYAMIPLAALLWMRHENAELAAVQAEMDETDLKRGREIGVENQRVAAAFALVEKISSTQDQAEKIRICDEIIDAYQDDRTTAMLRCVSYALLLKGQAAPDATEKARLLRVIVDRYGAVADETVNRYVMAALRDLFQLAGAAVEKIALCDDILEKQGDRLPDSATAWLLSAKAKATPDQAEQIAIYDAIVSRFASSADDSAFDSAVIAALDKMDLIADPDEQIRLCDIAIDAYLKAPDRTRHYLFERAIKKKAGLVDDPSLPLKLWNQVIANNATESSVVQARSLRIPLLKDDQERLAACDEFIAAHQDSRNDFVRLMVARIMVRKAHLLADSEKKAALLRAAVEKFAAVKDSRAVSGANQAMEMLAELGGGAADAIRYYDEKASQTENRLEAVRLLASKARAVKDSAEKIRLYDEIVVKVGDSREMLELREAVSALSLKARLLGDGTEKLRLYDEIVARSADSGDWMQRMIASEAMFAKGELLNGKEEKIRFYDTIIARGVDDGDWLSRAARAMLEKAALVDSREEKIRLYDAVLFDSRKIDNWHLRRGAFQDRIKLAIGKDEKLRLHDRYLAVAGGNLSPSERMSLLLGKVNVLEEPADKLRLCGEIIKYGKQYLHADGSGGRAPFLENSEKEWVFGKLGQAVLGKAELLNNAEEELKLYDEYLALPQADHFDFANTTLDKILAKKAELTGDPSVAIAYFDAKIRIADNDSERVRWYDRKASAARGAESVAVKKEMIAKFFDNTDQKVEWIIARLSLEMTRTVLDADEKAKLLDRLIERYQASADNSVLHMVVQAFADKAEAMRDEDAKLALYADVIDKYKDNQDFFVAKAVNEIIAAKFRMEEKKRKER